MQTSKYYVLYRSNSPIRTTATDKWEFFTILSTFEEVKALVDDKEDMQFRVIKGRELEFVEEIEEIPTRVRVVKSRKLKNA